MNQKPFSGPSACIPALVVLCTIYVLFFRAFSDESPYAPIAAPNGIDSVTQTIDQTDLIISALRYIAGDIHHVGINVINQDTSTVDSLTIMLYMRATEDEMMDLGARADVVCIYTIIGYLDSNEWLRDSINSALLEQHPVKFEDSYDETDQSYAWYLPIRLPGYTMQGGRRIRIDLAFQRRNYPFNDSLLYQSSTYVPDENDWSFRKHLKSNGEPFDFGGVEQGEKTGVDYHWKLEVNNYIGLFRNDQMIWGYAPSQSHMDKKTETQTRIIPLFPSQRFLDSATVDIKRIRVNQAGYRPGDQNLFYFIRPENMSEINSFTVIDMEDNREAGSGTLVSTDYFSSGRISTRGANNSLFIMNGDVAYELYGDSVSGRVFTGTLPPLAEGTYAVKIGSSISHEFIIDENVYGMVKDAVLKFFGIQRCGDSESWFHPACHLEDATPGGWHDCGDHLKEGITQSYAAAHLGLSAAVLSKRDTDHYGINHSTTSSTDGIPDVLYEAVHGADYALAAYENANGIIEDMVLSIGNYSYDHNFWGPPQHQDKMPQRRGGPLREARIETGANITANFSAALAFVGRMYREFDSTYSNTCLKVARELYDFAKNNQDATSTPAYHSDGLTNEECALAAIALCWATGESKYLDDLCYDKALGSHGNSDLPKISFEGGWFTTHNPMFGGREDFLALQAQVLWGFYSLLLKDEELIGPMLTELSREASTERLSLIEKTLYNLIHILSVSSEGECTIELPDDDFLTDNTLKYDGLWKWIGEPAEWGPNVIQMGNIVKLLCYADVAADIQGTELPAMPATTNWKADQVGALAVSAMNYMLGVNAWDVSMILGVGEKNFNHPFHRAANPEGRNSLYEYSYRVPVGALYAGPSPNQGSYHDDFSDYHNTEVSLHGAALTLFAAMMLAPDSKNGFVHNRKFTDIQSPGKNQTFTAIFKRNTLYIQREKSIPQAFTIELITLNGRKAGEVKRTFAGAAGKIAIEEFGLPLSSGFYLARISTKEKSIVLSLPYTR